MEKGRGPRSEGPGGGGGGGERKRKPNGQRENDKARLCQQSVVSCSKLQSCAVDCSAETTVLVAKRIPQCAVDFQFSSRRE